MPQGQPARGSIVGTGAPINVSCGFVARKVSLVNVSTPTRMEWWDGMAPGAGIKTATAGTMSVVSADGVSPFMGTPNVEGAGFVIGADTDLNQDGDLIYWEAEGDQ